MTRSLFSRFQPQIARGGGYAIALGYFGLFFVAPLAAIFSVTLAGIGITNLVGWTLNDLWPVLGFTFFQAALSTFFTLLAGLPGAYIFARLDFPGKKLLRILTTIPFILPAVVVAASFNAMLGPSGWFNILLMNLFQLQTPPIAFLNTFTGILVVHVFYNTSIILRTVGTSWSQLDPRLEDAAKTSGASPFQVLIEVTLPLLRQSILAALLLVFLFDFTSFGVIMMIGGPTFSTLETQVYTQSVHLMNLPVAGILSMIQLGCTLLITGLHNKLEGIQTRFSTVKVWDEGLHKPSGLMQKILIGGWILSAIILFVLPLLSLPVRSFLQLTADRAVHSQVQTVFTLKYYASLFVNIQQSIFYVPPTIAIGNSLRYALETVLITIPLSVILTLLLAGRSGMNRVLNLLIILPLGTSAVTLGLGFILLFNKPPLDVQSFPLLIPIAHSLVALPFAVRTLLPVYRSIPENLRDSARMLGANPFNVWWEVDLPIMTRAFIGMAIFTFAISLGEFGATMFLARPESVTIPLAIFRYLALPGSLNYNQALAMASILMVISAGSFFLMEEFQPSQHQPVAERIIR